MKMTALIVEDEKFAADRLVKMLQKYENIRVLDVAVDGEEAVEKTDRLEPDILFLDIQIPVFDGFEVLRRVAHFPYVVFVTAYDTYAIKAFEVNSVDYLLKPIHHDRLDRTVQRLTSLVRPEQKNLEKLLAMVAEKEADTVERLPIKVNDVIQFVPVEDILWCSADNKYVTVVTDKKEYLYDYSLKKLEEILPQNRFIRIHRSTLVNITRIVRLERFFMGDYTAIMSDSKGTALPVSKRYFKLLKEKLQM